MTVDHFICKFTNSNVDVQNFQLVDFDCDLVAAGMSAPQVAARLACYFERLGEANVIGDDTDLVEIQYRAPGSSGAVNITPDATAWAAAVAYTNASPYNWAISLFGPFPIDVGGAGALTPLGTSVSVSERTATPGPTGRGRHFLPFIGNQAVNGNGVLGTGQRADILQAYQVLFQGLDPLSKGSVLDEVWPLVTNHAGSTTHFITSVKAQPIFSNLESRRR